MTTITLPKTLARYTGGNAKIQTESATLYDALHALTDTYGLDTAILRENGDLQPYVRIVLGTRMIQGTSEADLKSLRLGGDSIELKTAFAGG